MDELGLDSTHMMLENNGIRHIGTGNNIREAQEGLICEINGKKIGFFACAEHEFSIATESSAGANPFDPLETPDLIEKMKTKCDYLIVLYHGGKEFYRYPSPYLQKYCRKMVDKGANLIICQHSHCIGCEEVYKGATIVYGQGNFIFDDEENEFYQTSILVSLDNEFNIAYLPIEKNKQFIRLATKKNAEQIMNDFYERSRKAMNHSFLEEEYTRFSKERIVNYLCGLSGSESLLFRALNKILHGKLRKQKVRFHYRGKALLAVRNYIECEAHRELILTALRDL